MINFFFRPLFVPHKKHTLYKDQPRRYIIHVLRLHVVSDGDQNQNLSTDFSKNTKYEISRKFFWLESRFSLRRDGRTDVKMLIVARKCFGNAPKKTRSDWHFYCHLPRWRRMLMHCEDQIDRCMHHSIYGCMMTKLMDMEHFMHCSHYIVLSASKS